MVRRKTKDTRPRQCREVEQFACHGFPLFVQLSKQRAKWEPSTRAKGIFPKFTKNLACFGQAIPTSKRVNTSFRIPRGCGFPWGRIFTCLSLPYVVFLVSTLIAFLCHSETETVSLSVSTVTRPKLILPLVALAFLSFTFSDHSINRSVDEWIRTRWISWSIAQSINAWPINQSRNQSGDCRIVYAGRPTPCADGGHFLCTRRSSAWN